MGPGLCLDLISVFQCGAHSCVFADVSILSGRAMSTAEIGKTRNRDAGVSYTLKV